MQSAEHVKYFLNLPARKITGASGSARSGTELRWHDIGANRVEKHRWGRASLNRERI
jgi:hypothetical protein